MITNLLELLAATALIKLSFLLFIHHTKVQYLLFIKIHLQLITIIAIFSLNSEIYHKVYISVNVDFSLTFLIYSTIATAPSKLQINFANSGLCFAISL
jgi:hypothetical protein